MAINIIRVIIDVLHWNECQDVVISSPHRRRAEISKCIGILFGAFLSPYRHQHRLMIG